MPVGLGSGKTTPLSPLTPLGPTSKSGPHVPFSALVSPPTTSDSTTNPTAQSYLPPSLGHTPPPLPNPPPQKQTRPASPGDSTTSDPDGIRTRVAALKGPCPRPLDDGANFSSR